MKQFELDAVYKGTINPAENSSKRTYQMQVYNRTAHYLKGNVFGRVERYKIKVNNDVEYINAGLVGRHSLIFTADSKISLPPVSKEIVTAISAMFSDTDATDIHTPNNELITTSEYTINHSVTEMLRREINNIDTQIAALNEKREKIIKEFWELDKPLRDIATRAMQDLRLVLKNDLRYTGLKLFGQNGERFFGVHVTDFRLFGIRADKGSLIIANDYANTVLAEYNNVEHFRSVIENLILAIQRGDEEFTFPPNVSTFTFNQ